MTRFIQLSYRIDGKTPLYPGTAPLGIKKVKEISNGDSCNTFSVTFSNHGGTHIDAPRHFLDSGKAIGSYLPAELIFNKPCLLDCPKGSDELIEIKDVEPLSGEGGFDALLIRTGFGKYRAVDAEVYTRHNPCLSPEAAKWVRGNFPGVRLIGIDTISVASSAHKDLGPLTHKILLDKEGFGGSPVLILEDMDLPAGIRKLDGLIVMPLFGGGVDSSPCSALGVIND